MFFRRLYEKYKQLNVEVKAALWYTFCNVLQKGIGVITMPIYVRLLDAAEFGQYNVFVSWTEILMIFATLNLYCGVFTKAMVDYSNDRDCYTSAIQMLSSCITLLLFFFYIIFRQQVSGCLGLNNKVILTMFAYFLFFPAFLFWSVRQRVENNYRSFVVITLLLTAMIPTVSLLFLFYTNLRAESLIYGFLLSNIMVGCFFYIKHLFVKFKLFDKKYWKYALIFNVPLIAHYLSLILLAQVDKIMIGYYCDDASVAFYSLSYSVALMMNILIAAINGSFVPWFYARLKVNEVQRIRCVSNGLVVGLAIVSVVVMIIAPEIVKILGTAEYAEAIYVIPPIVASVYVTFCYGLFSNVEFYFGATKFVMIASTTGAIFKVISNSLMLPYFGYISAGYTTLGCYIIFAVCHYCFMNFVVKNNMTDVKFFNIRVMLTMICILLVVIIFCNYIYDYLFFRMIMLSVFVLCIVCRKKQIIEIYNLMR